MTEHTHDPGNPVVNETGEVCTIESHYKGTNLDQWTLDLNEPNQHDTEDLGGRDEAIRQAQDEAEYAEGQQATSVTTQDVESLNPAETAGNRKTLKRNK